MGRMPVSRCGQARRNILRALPWQMEMDPDAMKWRRPCSREILRTGRQCRKSGDRRKNLTTDKQGFDLIARIRKRSFANEESFCRRFAQMSADKTLGRELRERARIKSK